MSGSNLMITGIGWLFTNDPSRPMVRDACLVARDGWIEEIRESPRPDWNGPILDAGGGIAIPGMINLHHHMYQNLARAYSPVCNLPLLPWVTEMNKIWEGFNADDLAIATRVALVELMLSGCTTALDHHYVFPRDGGDMIAAQFRVANELGVRFIAGRGSFDLDNDLMPDWAIDTTDAVLTDCERLLQSYHDPRPGSFQQIALAPTGPLVVTPELLRESAEMGRKYTAVVTTHNCESADEIPWAREQTGGRTPFEHLLDCGWDNARTVLAHSIQLDDGAVAAVGRHRMGIAHCPCSNMRLGSGICRTQDLRKAGAYVGLGVDGSASNDSGHLLNEARMALYLARVQGGAPSMTPEEAIEIATLGGARALGRAHDLGSLEPGKCADIALFPASDLWSSGAENPLHALLLCFPRTVDHLVVGGRIVVKNGQIPGIDIPELIEAHSRCARTFNSRRG